LGITHFQEKEIKTILLEKLRTKIDEYSEQEDMNKPFYFRLFSEESVYIASLLQSIYTWMGSKWENFAYIVARNNFDHVVHGYKLTGNITSEEQVFIDNTLKDMEQGVKYYYIKDIKRRLDPLDLDSVDSRESVENVDLYLKRDDNEYYIELKSVKPNKNEMRAAKQDLLNILAIRRKNYPINNIHTYLALPFNSYFTGEYRRWTVTTFFRNDDDLIVGNDLWEFLGGEGSYAQLLDIFEEVGKEVKTLLDEALASI